ncbi:MAG: ribbon-helix-helix domain-containing protein [Pyrinomonadaceae bacterium]|nr:ribbon-helix-helix protein, CopG family [Chloracidobacterium sp.]MBP7416498.1 ribbon-helix-helix protein, CopG family [Pyrinomonadaceae bacterium]
MENTTVNISMPKSMKDDVDKVVEAEGYGNTSEFFRDLVRGRLNERTQRRLDELILEGLNSGPSTPLTQADFEEIRRRGMERIAKRKK